MEPFRFFRTVNIPQNNQGVIASFTAPQNRTLHIEFIAGDVTLPAGESSSPLPYRLTIQQVAQTDSLLFLPANSETSGCWISSSSVMR